jgi:hypothetical protein
MTNAQRPYTAEEIELVWMCGHSGRDDTTPTARETKATCNSGHVIPNKAPAAYRVSKPKIKALAPLGLNAIGKPYTASYDPNYKLRTSLTKISRLRKPKRPRP